MQKFIKQLIKERRVTIFIAIIIAFMGMYSYYLLPKQESPEVSPPILMVITPYPGASSEEVKDLITKKVEEEIGQIDRFDYTDGISKDGVSIVIAFFEVDAEVDKISQDVRNAISDLKPELPSGAMESMINDDIGESAGIIISLSGDNYTYEQLGSFGQQFKKSLKDIEGISKFEIEGELEKEVKVEVDISKLNQIGLSIEDLSKLLKIQNIEIPSGDIKYGDTKITVKTPGIFSSIKDIENTILTVSPDTGAVSRLKDIAKVYMDLEEGVEKYKQKGKDAVLLTGYFSEGKNVLIVGKDVREIIDEVKATLPEDLIVEEVIYQPDDVSDSVNDFMANLLQGMLLVIIVVLLGMGVRNAVVVSVAIPLSILMTFGAMFYLKIYIHQLSLTALIVALGILVDNAIVISDIVQVKIDEGKDNLTAAYEGARSSSIPIFTATLTTIAAFSPLLGMPGMAGEFLGSIPQVLIISIVAAYIVAMFVTPSMAAIFFRKKENKADKENKIRTWFTNALNYSLKNKKATIGITVIALGLTLKVILPMLPSQFFPFADKDVFYININSEMTGNYQATEELTDDVVELLKEVPEITNYTVSIGNGLPKFYVTMPPAFPASDYGQMICRYDLDIEEGQRFENKEVFVNYIQDMIDENIPNGRVHTKLLAYAKPAPAKVIVKISGDNLDRIREVTQNIKAEVEKIEGTMNVRHDLKDKIFQLKVDVDNEKASSLGISQYDIQRQVNIALYGDDASVYRKDGKEYDIKLVSDISDVESLENMEIKSSITNKKIPLKQFATIGFAEKLDTLKTHNAEETVQLLIDNLPDYSAVDIADKIECELLPDIDTDGTSIAFEGEREDIDENFGAVGGLAFIALFAIYVILIVQFNSFSQPLIIMTTIPLSLIGSIWGLFILKTPMSLTAFLGIIALIGLVVKNGILLLEFINDARKSGLGIDQACLDAVDKRFNPIILSATTTVIGLFPLAISGSGLFAPMSISLMFGLMVSTFLTMIILPVIYSSVEGYLLDMKSKRISDTRREKI